MRDVSIVTDTTACVPMELVERYDIGIVPACIVIENKSLRDMIDFQPEDFYEHLRTTNEIPQTSSCTPETFVTAFREAARTSSHILCITPPVAFSAIYESAKSSLKLFKDRQDVAVEIIECTTASAGQGLAVVAGARAAADGGTPEEVRNAIHETMARVRMLASVDTLHYLSKSGRVPSVAAMANNLLNIKPVFSIKNADIHTLSLSTSVKSSMKKILDVMESSRTPGEQLHVAVMHTNAFSQAQSLKEMILSRFQCYELFITEMSPVAAAHTGPGLVGVAYYGENPLQSSQNHKKSL